MKFFILVHPSNLQETVVQTTAHLETNRFLPSEPIMQMTVQLFPKVEFNREIIFAIHLPFYLCSLSCLLHHGFEILSSLPENKNELVLTGMRNTEIAKRCLWLSEANQSMHSVYHNTKDSQD